MNQHPTEGPASSSQQGNQPAAGDFFGGVFKQEDGTPPNRKSHHHPPQGSVIAIVKGGLGNQLFIYAAARTLALRTNRTLHLDIRRGYTDDTYGRSYRLDRFPIHAEIMPEEWRVAPTLKHPLHKIKRAWSKLLPPNRRRYLAERQDQPETQLTELRPAPERIALLGYWQSEAYFTDRSEAIRRELTPPAPADEHNQILGKEMENSESVFVHVRRIRYHPRLDAGYYQSSISLLRKYRPQARFHLFGDDLPWLRDHIDFGGCDVKEISHNNADELADLWLMSRCRHAIVANSSFSWWGAWLGAPNPTRLVCFPSPTGLPLRPALGWQTVTAAPETDAGT